MRVEYIGYFWMTLKLALKFMMNGGAFMRCTAKMCPIAFSILVSHTHGGAARLVVTLRFYIVGNGGTPVVYVHPFML